MAPKLTPVATESPPLSKSKKQKLKKEKKLASKKDTQAQQPQQDDDNSCWSSISEDTSASVHAQTVPVATEPTDNKDKPTKTKLAKDNKNKKDKKKAQLAAANASIDENVIADAVCKEKKVHIDDVVVHSFSLVPFYYFTFLWHL